MSLILCRQEPVKQPYFIEELGLSIYSSQELCYVIYNHAILVLDGFVNDSLVEFIREQLDMGFLSLKLERWRQSNENPDDMLYLILSECSYYSTMEINRFKNQIASLRKLKPSEYARARADYMFSHKQYKKAIAGYEKLVHQSSDSKNGDEFYGKVLGNLGSAYARMFRFDKAYQCLEQSYTFMKSEEVLKRIYYLTKLEPALIFKERFLAAATPELLDIWDQDFNQAKERAAADERTGELDKLFLKDPLKRMAGASALVQKWKKEYRNLA